MHERTLQGDFLMALLRDIVAARRSAGNPLKVWLCCTLAFALLSLGNHCRRLLMQNFWAMAQLGPQDTLATHEWWWLVMDARGCVVCLHAAIMKPNIARHWLSARMQCTNYTILLCSAWAFMVLLYCMLKR